MTREQLRIDLEELWLATRKTVVFITHSIDEAVLLADRVLVMSPRPGRIEQVIAVDLPRPRGLDGRRPDAFDAAVERITEIFLSRGVLHGGRGSARRCTFQGARADHGRRRSAGGAARPGHRGRAGIGRAIARALAAAGARVAVTDLDEAAAQAVAARARGRGRAAASTSPMRPRPRP